jgi:hypothetical protein
MKNNLVVEKKKVQQLWKINISLQEMKLKEAKGNTVNETQGITEMKFYFIFFPFKFRFT